jgi:hypothetical protein
MTVTRVACPDDPRHIESELMCLYAVSKDFRGELRLEESEIEDCEQRRCKTLKTRHLLRLEVASHRECDSEEAGVFGGVLQSKDLASAFVDGSGDNRGFHGATFLWRDPQSGVYITGTLSGMTNAGVHREPAGKDCQRCDERGVMEGRLCGQIRRGPRELRGCNIIGIYLLRFDANAKGGDGAVQGTFEGVIVCPCG